MVQALYDGDRVKRVEFSNVILRGVENDNFAPHLIFSDEATFNISGKVNRHKVRMWGRETPHFFVVEVDL